MHFCADHRGSLLQRSFFFYLIVTLLVAVFEAIFYRYVGENMLSVLERKFENDLSTRLDECISKFIDFSISY